MQKSLPKSFIIAFILSVLPFEYTWAAFVVQLGLPDSAQIFYRRALLHHNFASSPFYLITIAEYTGLVDRNPTNLATTVENSILKPLIELGYIDSYEKNGGDPRNPKYTIKRSGPGIKKMSDGEG